MPCNSEDFPVPCDRCQEELPGSETLEGEKSTVEVKSCCYVRLSF